MHSVDFTLEKRLLLRIYRRGRTIFFLFCFQPLLQRASSLFKGFKVDFSVKLNRHEPLIA